MQHTGEMYDKATGTVSIATIGVYNLLSRDGISYMLNNFVSNVISYSPLGVMLVMFLGIGMADGSGLIAVALRKVVKHAPAKLLIPILMLIGVCGNLASSSATLVLCPIAAIIFLNYGRHPIAGMMGVLAAITSGYSANLLVTDTDAVLSSITQEAARILMPGYEVTPMANYYFLVASSFLLALVSTFVTTKIIEPMLGEYDPSMAGENLENYQLVDLTAEELPAEEQVQLQKRYEELLMDYPGLIMKFTLLVQAGMTVRNDTSSGGDNNGPDDDDNELTVNR